MKLLALLNTLIAFSLCLIHSLYHRMETLRSDDFQFTYVYNKNKMNPNQNMDCKCDEHDFVLLFPSHIHFLK